MHCEMTAATPPSGLSGSISKCGRCNSRAIQPMVLSCLHSCCSECVNSLLEDGVITCPQCKKTVTVRGENSFLEILSQILAPDEATPKCQICEARGIERDAAQVCLRCPPPNHYCDECTGLHTLFFPDKIHRLVTRSGFMQSGGVHPRDFPVTMCACCSKSKPEVSCRGCMLSLCLKCGVARSCTKGGKHDIEDKSAIVDRYRKDIQREVDRFKLNSDCMNEKIQAADAEIRKIQGENEELIYRLKQHHSRLLEEMRNQEELLQELCQNSIVERVTVLSQMTEAREAYIRGEKCGQRALDFTPDDLMGAALADVKDLPRLPPPTLPHAQGLSKMTIKFEEPNDANVANLLKCVMGSIICSQVCKSWPDKIQSHSGCVVTLPSGKRAILESVDDEGLYKVAISAENQVNRHGRNNTKEIRCGLVDPEWCAPSCMPTQKALIPRCVAAVSDGAGGLTTEALVGERASLQSASLQLGSLQRDNRQRASLLSFNVKRASPPLASPPRASPRHASPPRASPQPASLPLASPQPDNTPRASPQHTSPPLASPQHDSSPLASPQPANTPRASPQPANPTRASPQPDSLQRDSPRRDSALPSALSAQDRCGGRGSGKTELACERSDPKETESKCMKLVVSSTKEPKNDTTGTKPSIWEISHPPLQPRKIPFHGTVPSPDEYKNWITEAGRPEQRGGPHVQKIGLKNGDVKPETTFKADMKLPVALPQSPPFLPLTPSSRKSETVCMFQAFRAILNKLTPQTTWSLKEEIKQLQINTETRLRGIADIFYEKAVTADPNLCVAYALLCFRLKDINVPMNTQENPERAKTVTFRKILLRLCQNEFETDSLDETEVAMDVIGRAEGEEKKLLEEELQMFVSKAKRRSLGNIRFIGELFKLKMITENIIHNCIITLLKTDKDEESLECLCQLLKTIGKEIDTPLEKTRNDQYYRTLESIATQKRVSSKVCSEICDLLDLRKIRKGTARLRIDQSASIAQNISRGRGHYTHHAYQAGSPAPGANALISSSPSGTHHIPMASPNQGYPPHGYGYGPQQPVQFQNYVSGGPIAHPAYYNPAAHQTAHQAVPRGGYQGYAPQAGQVHVHQYPAAATAQTVQPAQAVQPVAPLPKRARKPLLISNPSTQKEIDLSRLARKPYSASTTTYVEKRE